MAANSPTPTGRRSPPRRALAWVAALGVLLAVGLLVVLSWPTNDGDGAASGAGLSGSSAGSVAGGPEPSANDGPAVPGAASLRATEPLLGPAAGSAPMPAAAGDPAGEVVFRGRVVDETGAGVAGATVLCIPNSATQRQLGLVLYAAQAELGALARTTTDALGRFVLHDRSAAPGQAVAARLQPSELASFALPDESAAPFPSLAVVSDRFAPAAHVCLGFESGEYDAGDIAVEPGGWLSGRAVDEAGRPVGVAVVLPQRAVFEPRHGTPLPDAATVGLLCRLLSGAASGDGRFEIGPLWNGNARLEVSAEFFRTTIGGPYDVPAGETRDVGDVVLRRGLTLAGLVVDPEGRPVAGARVYAGEFAPREFAPDSTLDSALLELRDFALEAPALTGPDGRFALTTLGAGYHRLFVDAPGFELVLLSGLEPPVDGLRIELARAATLELTVVDAATDAPLEQASVVAVRRRGQLFTVDKDARLPVVSGEAASLAPGVFRVERLGTQRTDLVVGAPGHEPSALALEGVAPGTMLTREVRLSRGATISGRVLGLDGAGLPGALVTVVSTSLSPSARVQLVQLGYVGEASSNSNSNSSSNAKSSGLAADDPPTVALALATPPQALSGEDGRYELAGVGPGAWSLRATLAGHQRSERPVEVASGAQLEGVDLQMEAGGVLFGTVTDGDGAPERGVSVRAKIEARPQAKAELHETYSDIDGAFEFTGLRPGSWSIGRGRDGTRQVVELASGARVRVDLAAEPVGTVMGRLLVDGRPIEGVVSAGRPTGKAQLKDLQQVRTDAAGRYELKLPAGEWMLRGSGAAPTFGLTESASVVVGARSSQQIDLLLAGSPVTGTVVDARGAPIAGVTVRLQDGTAVQTTGFGGLRSNAAPGPVTAQLWPSTDAQGRFVIPHVPAASYTVIATHPEYRSARLEAVALGTSATTELELTLKRITGFSATVKLPSGDPVPAGFRVFVTASGNGTEIGKPIHDGAVEFIRLEPGTYNVAVFGPKPGAFKLGTQGTSEETPLLEQVLSLAEGEREALALVVQL